MDIIYIAYPDDIFIYSVNFQTHIQNVQKVLEQLFKHCLYVKLKKRIFKVEKIVFLGLVLITQRVKIEVSRVDTIKEWSFPTSFKDIQSFLEFANFYHRFIKRFSRIVASLTLMLKRKTQSKFKANFVITNDAQELFHNLHQAFITAEILYYFNF